MKNNFFIILILILFSCGESNQLKPKTEQGEVQNKKSLETNDCNYIKDYQFLGNKFIDTVRIGKRLVDPIDEFMGFEKADFGFVIKDSKLFKKSKTHRKCNGKMVAVEYYQEFTNQIDLLTYKAYDDVFFTTKNKVFFWWANSDGHFIIPIDNADPKTFKPFENICGGVDESGIYYGSPNFGVYQLDIPLKSNFELVAKKNNYWNSPNHYVVVDNKVYDIKHEINKGYFCELDKSISTNEVLKMKVLHNSYK